MTVLPPDPGFNPGVGSGTKPVPAGDRGRARPTGQRWALGGAGGHKAHLCSPRGPGGRHQPPRPARGRGAETTGRGAVGLGDLPSTGAQHPKPFQWGASGDTEPIGSQSVSPPGACGKRGERRVLRLVSRRGQAEGHGGRLQGPSRLCGRQHRQASQGLTPEAAVGRLPLVSGPEPVCQPWAPPAPRGRTPQRRAELRSGGSPEFPGSFPEQLGAGGRTSEVTVTHGMASVRRGQWVWPGCPSRPSTGHRQP